MTYSEITKDAARSKFFPPQVDPAKHLFRTRFVNKLLASPPGKRKLLLIEAQAGQGKSTFAAQYLSHLRAAFSWYQLEAEDGDPILLITSLLASLQQSLPGFSSALLEDMLANGAIPLHEQAGYVDILLSDLDAFLQGEFYLVLDDIYLLEDSPLSQALVGRLVSSAPRRLNLILISRRPILPSILPDCPVERCMVVGTGDLALNRREIATLFNTILEVPVTTEAVRTLHRLTEGWVMGLILAGEQAQAGDQGLDRIDLRGSSNRNITEYFSQELIQRFPTDLNRSLMRLSLLEEIPVELAQQLAEVERVGEALTALEGKNFFVRCLDEEKNTFVFHHLFRDCLRALLEKEFGREEICQILNRAAGWHLDNDRPEDALRYYLDAGNYQAAQKVLSQVGMALHARNRIVTLQGALKRIPEDVAHKYPWLAYFNGIVQVNTNPPDALSWFEEAHSGFCKSSEELGELMALIQMVHYYVAVDPRFNRGRPLLERASRLYNTLADQLEAPLRINAANILLLGFTFVTGEMEKADQYLTLGLNLAQEEGLENLEAEARMARCYRYLLGGDHRATRREVDRSLQLLRSPRVSAINKGALQLSQLNLLANEGDNFTFQFQKGRFRTAIGKEIVEKSIFGAIMRLWDMDIELSEGKVAEARETIRQALESGFAGASSHLRSQYLQYHAHLLSLEDKAEQALAAAKESLALRTEVGGQTFEAINCGIVGATFARLGMVSEGEELFERGLAKSEAMGEFFIRATLYALRAEMRLDLGEEASSREDIGDLLSILRDWGYLHFYGWTPELMERLLGEAVRSGIEIDYARKLAAERLGLAILDNGEVIPLLKISTLGRFEIELNGRVVLRTADLSAAQRQLLALLLASPSHQLNQEEIQHALWPDSPPSKSRSSFDNLVSRLRKTLDKALGRLSVKNYLSLQKGVLCLENCWFDFMEFAEKVRQGQSHVRQRELWQADNAFRIALPLWQGEFMPCVQLDGNVELKRRNLHLLYLESALKWCKILTAFDQTSEAIQVAEKALLHEPTNESLVQTLYNLYVREGDAIRTRKTLTRYSEGLKRDGFSPEEVEDILDSFWGSYS